MNQFEAPIPGQSLTEPPGSRPYERPPETVDPEEALQLHLKRLSEPEKMEAIADVIELGVDIKSFTSGYLRSAVASGIHTVDVSLLIAPVIHEFVKGVAEDFDVEYKEGFVNEEKQERQKRQVAYAKARAKLEKDGYLEEEADEEEAIPFDSEELPDNPPEEPRGIMQRRMKNG